MLKIATKEQAAGFAKQWTVGGVAIFLDNVHLQFAADFANIVVTSYMADLIAKQKAAAAAKIQVAGEYTKVPEGKQ